MYCCPHCKSKVKTKSSLNRHLKEACKVLKNANRRRPTSEIQLGSPSGSSQLSALGNPEYLPPAFTANATIESVTCELNNFDGLSPLKFTPQKRSCVHENLSDSNKEPRQQATPAAPTVAPAESVVALNFEDDISSSRSHIPNGDDDSALPSDNVEDDLSSDSSVSVVLLEAVDSDSEDSSASENESIADSVFNLNSVSGIERIRTSVSDFDLNFLEQEDADSNLSSGSENLSSGSEISVDSAVDRIILEENNPEVSEEFFKAEDFMDVSSCVNSEAPSNLRVEEELLLHIIKEEQLPPRVFDRIMKWGRLCRDNNYDFEAPGFRTVMKRWKDHYLNSALKEPSLKYVQEDWQSVPSQVPVIDPLPQITAILNDSELMAGALWSSDVRTSVDGSRLYGDINTGNQWCMAERKMNSRIKVDDPHSACHHHCGVLLFDDNTMGDGLGRLQIQPVLGTICILPKQSRRNVKGWFILGIVPPYPRTSQERTADRNKLKTKHQYLQWYHACLAEILEPLNRLCRDRRGIPFMINGQCRILHFELAGIIGDTKGHAEMCANYNAHSSVISKCNRDCNIPQRNADNPFFRCVRTNCQDVYDVVNESLMLMQTTDHGNKSARENVKRKLKNLSQHPVLPYYSNFEFCGDPEGVFGCTPWELLHVWYLGIMKLILQGCYNFSRTNSELIKWYRHRLRGHSKGDLALRPKIPKLKNSVLFPKPKLEERLRFIQTYSRRQSDRYMPRGPFREGVTDLTRLSGQEYPGLMLFSMVAFKGIFHGTRLEKDEGMDFAADLERRMCLLCFLALSLDVEMTLEEMSEKQRMDLERKVEIFLDFFRRTLGLVIEYGSQTGLRRPKYHAPLHIVRDIIPKYGSTTNTFGGYLESFLKILVKEPLKRTSRKHGSFQWELMSRYSEEQVRRASKERLASRGYDVSGGNEEDPANQQQSVSQSGSASSRMTNRTLKGRWFTPGGTVFYCLLEETTKEWQTYNAEGAYLRGGVYHPGYAGNAEAREWVIQMVNAAIHLNELSDEDKPKYDRIDFTYHLKTPNSNDDAHDIFRCHPNFHGSPLKRNPWHDWAMVRYEAESNQGITKSYDVACKVCLWGVFRNSNAAADDSSDHLDVYGAFHPMKEYEPQKDKTLPFITKDRLADHVEILSFDTVVSTAYVLPINWSRTDPFPQSRQETTTYCVIPPRASWPDLGWDDKLLQRKEMQDTNKLPFI